MLDFTLVIYDKVMLIKIEDKMLLCTYFSIYVHFNVSVSDQLEELFL